MLPVLSLFDWIYGFLNLKTITQGEDCSQTHRSVRSCDTTAPSIPGYLARRKTDKISCWLNEWCQRNSTIGYCIKICNGICV